MGLLGWIRLRVRAKRYTWESQRFQRNRASLFPNLDVQQLEERRVLSATPFELAAAVPPAMNVPPTAEAGGPYSGNEGSSVTLDGGGSTDSDGTIALYEWDLDNDGQYDDATGVTAVFNSTDDGTFTVGLRVTDDGGASSTDTATVTISNMAPTAEAGGPYSGTEGSSVTLDGSGSTDPGNDIALYEWDLDNDGQYDDATGVTAVFNSTDDGTFTIGLRVTDDDGASSTDTATVTISNAAPTAEAGGPYSGTEGSGVTLDGSGSTDPGNDIALYEWDLDNDGQYDDATGVTATFNSTDDGTFTVGLRVTDDDGASSTDTATVTISNAAPTAEAGGPYSGTEGSSVTLDGSGSTDPGNDIALYEWDLDNDGQYDDATGVAATFNSTDDGTFTVGLRVTDDDGASSTDTATVTISNAAPTAEAGGPYSGTEGSGVTLDGSGSTDPGNDIALYEWDLDNDGQYDDATGVTATFNSTDDGTFTVGLRVTDDDGASSTDTATVTISNAAPTAEAGGPYSGTEGSSVTLDGSGSTDPGNDIALYEWDLDNDGQYDDATGVAATFNSTDDGTFTVGLRVTDDDGTSSTDTATVIVDNVAPIIALSGASNVDEGATYTLTLGAVTDPGDDTVVEYIVHWGDGNTNTYTSGGDVTHAYADGPATHNITVDLVDEDGTYTGVGTLNVTVDNVAPVAADHYLTTDEDGPAAPFNVLDGLNDPGTLDTHTAVPASFTTGKGGMVTISADGAATYDPNGQFEYLAVGESATDSFTYTVQDDDGGSDVGTVTFTITGVNDAPTATANSYTTDEDISVSGNVITDDTGAGMDSDTDTSDVLTATLVSGPASGSLTLNSDGSFAYTPDVNFDGLDSFVYMVSDGQGGSDTATVTLTVRNLVDVSGRVFNDRNNDSVFEPSSGDAGIGGVVVKLYDQATGTRIDTQTTAADGTYTFDVNLGSGTYQIIETQPANYLDGKETAGTLGGTVDNAKDSNEITGIIVVDPHTTPDGEDYQFAELSPSSISGFVWIDYNDDGRVQPYEPRIEGVRITLGGIDHRGMVVSMTTYTDSSGFRFGNLRPGNYWIREEQPLGIADGKEVLGRVDGTPTGLILHNDEFRNIVLTPGAAGRDYGFGEAGTAPTVPPEPTIFVRPEPLVSETTTVAPVEPLANLPQPTVRFDEDLMRRDTTEADVRKLLLVKIEPDGTESEPVELSADWLTRMDELLEKFKERWILNGRYRIDLLEPGFPPRKLLEFYKSGDSIGEPVRDPGRGSNPMPDNAANAEDTQDTPPQAEGRTSTEPGSGEPVEQAGADVDDSASASLPAALPTAPEEGNDASSHVATWCEQPRMIRRPIVAIGLGAAATATSRRCWSRQLERIMEESDERAFSLAARLRRRFQR